MQILALLRVVKKDNQQPLIFQQLRQSFDLFFDTVGIRACTQYPMLCTPVEVVPAFMLPQRSSVESQLGKVRVTGKRGHD